MHQLGAPELRNAGRGTCLRVTGEVRHAVLLSAQSERGGGRLLRGLPHALVLMMIDRLRSEDMYSQIPSYPMPPHRSPATPTRGRGC